MTAPDSASAWSIRQLRPDDATLFDGLLDLFAAAFDETDIPPAKRPSAAYRRALLDRPGIVVLVAASGDEVIGGLVAHELPMIVQAGSELYIYDLAVAEPFRRRGIATALIAAAAAVARDRGASAMFVQTEADNAAAAALYSRISHAEPVLQFDLPLRSASRA